MALEYLANGTPKQFGQMVYVLNHNKAADQIRFNIPSISYLDQAPDASTRAIVWLISPPDQIIATIHAIILPNKETLITIEPVEGSEHEWEEHWRELLAQLRNRGWRITDRDSPTRSRKRGQNKLPYVELVYRLAKAQVAEELKSKDPNLTWREIVEEIQFDRGRNLDVRTKILYYARRELEDAISLDKQDLLNDVKELRVKWKGKE